MRDVLHAVAGQPLPGIIIVQIGDALCIRAAAAELADIVAQGGRADERDVDRKPGFLRALGGQRGDVVHADGVRSGVKRQKLPADAQHGHKMRGVQCGVEGGQLIGDTASVLRAVRGQIGQHIERRILAGEHAVQQLCQRGKHRFLRRGLIGGIGEQTVVQPRIQRGQPSGLRLRRKARQQRAQGGHDGEAYAAPIILQSVQQLGRALQSGGRHERIQFFPGKIHGSHPLRTCVSKTYPYYNRIFRLKQGQHRIIQREHSVKAEAAIVRCCPEKETQNLRNGCAEIASE